MKKTKPNIKQAILATLANASVPHSPDRMGQKLGKYWPGGLDAETAYKYMEELADEGLIKALGPQPVDERHEHGDKVAMFSA